MATTKWAIDPTHSTVGFKVKHMMFTNVAGKFENYEANIVTDGDDFTKANIEFSADINSIDTRNADRDNHLKSADFFDAEKFPGKRGLKKAPKALLEMALMGDGVPADQVYEALATPEGLDRAFAKLDTIKRDVVWWESGARHPSFWQTERW